ncbi:MAG: hypothetical protein JW850_11750 [Thermoflexales bacterium]|nr:hypothetical protein [Thermoflexales bacterium]
MSEYRQLPSPRPYRRPSLFWPILLIGAGVIFLLSNLGLLPADPWPLLWNMWPLILIIIGLDILLGRRSVVGGVLSAILALLLVGGVVTMLFVAQNYPQWGAWGNANLRQDYVSHPLGGVEQAKVVIDFPSSTSRLFALDDSSNLIEANLRYYGSLNKSVSVSGDSARVRLDSRWDNWWGGGWWRGGSNWIIGLHPAVEYDLELDSGSSDCEFELSQLRLRSFRLDAGSGRIRLTLPERGQYRLKLNAGSGDIDIDVPAGVDVRLEYEAGSGELDTPGLREVSRRGRDAIYESDEFSQAGDSVTIELDGGSGDVRIR